MIDIKNKIKSLVSEINLHNKAYYEEDNPRISDYEYDLLMKELIALEGEYPQFKEENSPSENVGGKALSKFSKVAHREKQLSLANAFSREDLLLFDNRISKGASNYSYTVENKFDGLSVILTYQDGQLKLAATRGDGEVGEDITDNAKVIKNIPKTLPKKETLVVRGEAFISKENFSLINEKRKENGEKLFANPRNMAAGTLRQLDSKIVRDRNIDIFIFNLEYIKGKDFDTHSQSLEYLKSLGFPISEYSVLKDINEVYENVSYKEENKDNFPYEIDGAVIKVNEIEKRTALGATSKYPKWATAYKFSQEKVETILEDIIVQVGRTGVLTPVAILKGVNVGGSFVEKATLHNEEYILENDLRIKDKVVIIKAGDVIPRVVGSIKEKRVGDEKIFSMPSFCPVCGGRVERVEGNTVLKCTNEACDAKTTRKVIHFASKGAMNIEGLGEKIILTLMDKGFIENIGDIYTLKDHKEELMGLDKMGEKSVENLLFAIEKSKENELDALLFALSIDLLGRESAKKVCSVYNTMEEIMGATYEQLMEINEIGPKVAFEIIEFFKNDKNKEIINSLKKSGLNMKYDKKESASEIFEGLTFVLTGTLENFTREEGKKIIENYGGRVTSSVSKNTSYVLAGKKAGSKEKKARELGVKVISEEEFEGMIKE